jgi:mono/diheme cytochrome c family protein
MQHVLQIALSTEALSPGVSRQLLTGIATRYDTSALMRDAILSSLSNNEFKFMQSLLATTDWRIETPSREIFVEMLTSSVVKKRDPSELKMLLSWLDVDKASFGWHQKTIVTGMAIQGMSGKIKSVKLPAAPSILKRRDLEISSTHLQGISALFEWPGSQATTDSAARKGTNLDEQAKQQFAVGRKYYLSTCSGCHGNDGMGISRFGPPLKGSEWVLGDEERLTLILLHGLEGPLVVRNKLYDKPEILPVMPGHSTLDDGTIAAILTYIRNEWGNEAGPVTRRSVGTTRLTNQGRVLPWTAEELNAHMQKTKDP